MKEQLKTRQQILNEIGELINELNNLPKSAGDVGDSQVLIDILTERFELSSIVFNNISEAMYLMKVEEDTFRMAIVNDAFLQITGFSKENIIGNTPEIFIHEPFREFTLGKYKEAVASNSVQRYENTIDFGNGILVLDVNITPISLQRSNTKYLFGEFRDITQKKAAEKELKLANERLSSLWEISGLENLDDKEIYDRVVNTIVEMTDSPHGFFGIINEDETKMTILSWLGDVMKDCSMVNKPMEYMIEEAGMWGDVLRKRKPIIENNVKSKRFPEGHIELTRLLVCPIYSGKEIVSIAAVANKKSDYSESDLKQVSAYLNGVQLIIDKKKSEIKLKEFSEELMKMNETKEKLMSIISHDLRSPIQGLLGISEALAEEIDILSREEVIEYAKEINIAVKIQYRLLMDLLDWSKIHRTDFKIVNEILDLYSEVDTVIESFRLSAIKKNITIKNSVDKDIVLVFDKKLIQLILRNLISNGLKFTNSGGRIEIAAIMKDKRIQVSVEDNGVGLDSETMQKIFTNIRFSKKGTESEKGSGLGLPLCKEVLDKLGGKIWVESEIDKGSKFTFELII